MVMFVKRTVDIKLMALLKINMRQGRTVWYFKKNFCYIQENFR
jgi:hypothetical protein